MDLNNIPVGYGLLFHGYTAVSKEIQDTTGNRYNHAGISLGKGWMRDASVKGVKRTSLTDYLTNEILVFKVKSASEADHIQTALRSGDYANMGYGFIQLKLIYLYRRKKWWWIRELLILWNSIHKKMICSELVAQCWIDSGKNIVSTGIDMAEVVPGDLDPAKNPKIEKVTVFGAEVKE